MAYLPAYLKTNLITAVASAGTHDAYYTRANLFDGKAAKPFKASGLTGTITLTITTSGACDSIAIIGHNIPTGAGVSLTPAGGSAITVTNTSTAGSLWKKFTSANPATWDLTITKSGMTSIQIGEILMGVCVPMTARFSYGWTQGLEYASDALQTEFGSVIPYERYNIQTYNLPYNTITAAEKTEIETLYRAVKGGVTPFVFALDQDGSECIYGRIVNALGATATTYGLYSSALQIRGESEGVIL